MMLAAWSLAAAAAAQSSAAPRWEIEAYGGAIAARTTSGHQTLPPAGATLLTSTPIFPSRETATWFLGDGATLLNGVNADFGVAGRIAPLDAMVGPLDTARGAAFGVRVRRRLTSRLSAEFSLDAMAAPGDRRDGLDAAVDAARDSFAAAFADLLSTGPFAGIAISTSGAAEPGHRRDTAATLALNARVGRLGSFVPYLTFGAGVLTGSGRLPSASLEGHYRFSVLGEVPIDETDRLSLRFVRGASFTWVVGGGLRREVSSRWDVHIDARVLAGLDNTRVLLDAHPSVLRAAPGGFIESFTNPAVQFSNDPSTGRSSTLSGALDGFEAFTGGLQSRTLITVGVSRRF